LHRKGAGKMDEKYYYLSSWAQTDTKRYFVPVNLNLFIVYDELEKTTIALGIEKEDFYQGNLYSKCILYKDKIVFVPLHAKHFLIVDLFTYEMEYVDVPKCNGSLPEYGLFSGGYIIGDCLYAIGYMYSGIVKINLISKEYHVSEINDPMTYSSYYDGTNNIFVTIKGGGNIQYSVEDGSVKKFVYCSHELVGTTGNKNAVMSIDNEDNTVIRYDIFSEQVEKVSMEGMMQYFQKTKYRFLEFIGEKIYLVPETNGPIIVMDEKRNIFHTIWLDKNQEEGFSAIAVFTEKGNLYVADNKKKKTYVLDCEREEVKVLAIPISRNTVMKSINQLENKTVKEGIVDLSDFINCLTE